METKTKVRSLSEILIEADKTEDILKLKRLSEELFYNKQHYKLYEVTFGLEHIIEIGKRCIKKQEINKLFS